MSENRRDEYRVLYPIADRPRLVIGDCTCEVLDLSEHGIRLLAANLPPDSQDTIDGTVRFANGETVQVAGRILRRTDRQVVVTLDRQPLPYPQIVKEQRRLLAKYRR